MEEKEKLKEIERVQGSKDAKELLSKFSTLYNSLKLKYNELDILQTLEKEEMFIPSSIFNKQLSSLETISKYLIENKNLSLKQISLILNRSNRNIWNSYNSSKKKFPHKLVVKESHMIPCSVLRDLKHTLLENIVIHLKDTVGLRYNQIASILKRDERTIWTVYQRAKKNTGSD
jgi:hypothetical protein